MTRPKYLSMALAVAIMLLAGCGSDDGTTTRTFDFSAAEAEIDAFIAETAAVDGVGMVLVHRDDGMIYQQSFGNFTNDRISLLASSSKSATVGVLLRLADQGLLDMDAPIADQVASWEGFNPDVTVAQLLSNSSGLVGLFPNPGFGPYLCQYLSRGTLQECAERIFTTEDDDENDVAGLAAIPPDTQFRYGGGQWQVAGGVAEIVSGKSWAQLIEETYTEPCGLDVFEYANHFTDLALNEAGYPDGFDGDPMTLNATDNPNMEGGLFTTTADYGKFLLMQLRGGSCGDRQVLSEESVLRMRTDRIGPTYGANTGFGQGGYGLGWWIIGDQLAADPGAYGAFPWIDDSRNYAGFIVMEANSALGNQLFDRTSDLINEEIDRQY